MLRIGGLALVGLLAFPVISASAVPEAFKRTTDNGKCNHDNCLRAVIASNAKPGSASASQDCVSFFAKTVTPCKSDAPTVTVTNYVTSTGIAPTDTAVVTETVTAGFETNTNVVSFTTTVATQDVPNTVATQSVQNTITATATQNVVETVTSYVTVTKPVYNFSGQQPPIKRKEHLGGRDVLVKKACSVCPVTLVPTAVPTYASACSGMSINIIRHKPPLLTLGEGTVRYSSACSCIGVTQNVVTASPTAVTVTVTSAVYNTPAAVTVTNTAYVSVTGTTTVTNTQEVDVTYTNVVPVTATEIEEPATITQTQTNVQTVTVTSTSTVPGATQYCQMNLQAKGGTVDGRMISIYPNQASNVISPAGSNLKAAYVLSSNGKVHPADGTFVGQTLYSYGASSYVNIITDANIATYRYNPITCTVDDSLQVFCQAYSSTRPWIWSDGYMTPQGPYLWLNTFVQVGSTAFTLYAVPVNCVN